MRFNSAKTLLLGTVALATLVSGPSVVTPAAAQQI